MHTFVSLYKHLSSLALFMVVDAVNKSNGDVAQLARALDWQSRGRRFESDLLHFKKAISFDVAFLFEFFVVKRCRIFKCQL